jgi:hypothetical protein
VTQLNIDNTCDSIGAIDTRSAIFQNFDAFNRRARDRIEIDKCDCAITRSERIRSNAATVD